MSTTGFDVPVALFVFNRPEFVRQVMEVLAQVQPRTLLVIADGPRASVASDGPRCAESRRLATTPQWPCEVITNFADTNMGCDRRLRSGLEWVFATVERAVINEDDIVAHPSWFAWAAHQLDRYAGHDDISMVSGRNVLGRYEHDGADHLIVRRGSIHGWATWASSWNRTDHTLSAIDRDDVFDVLGTRIGDPLALAHSALLVRFARMGVLGAWDARWGLASLLADRWAVIPPVNLTGNVGYGAHGTRTTNAADLRPGTPVFTAPATVDGDRPAPSLIYDRWTLLVELMATYVRPEATVRLGRHRSLLRNADGSPDAWALAHLVPLDHLDDSIAALRHLRAAGNDHGALAHLLSVLESHATVAP